MALVAPKTVKVTNLLNRNDGALFDYKIEWTPVSGADGYKIYSSIIPYGNFTEIIDVPASQTEYIDTSSTIVATNDRELYSSYTNEETIVSDFVNYYSVVPYTIDPDGNKEEGQPSKPVTEEDSRLSCAGPFDKPYMIGNFPVTPCGLKYGLPSNKYTKQITNIIREEAIYLLQRDGQWVWWFKRKHRGERCPHVEMGNNQCMYGDNCKICYGTNLVGGFYDPVLIKMVVVYGQKKMAMEDLGIRAIRESKSWTIWQPKIAARDFFVLANGKRCEITSVTPSSPYMGGIYNKVDFDFRELEIGHAFYSIKVPGPIPAN